MSAAAQPSRNPASRRRDRAERGAASVSWRSGVHLAGTRLWCDAPRANDLCFVSSAAALPAMRPVRGTLLCTELTHRLICSLRGSRRGAEAAAGPGEPVLLSPVGRPFNYGSLRIELFPSGQGPGAASLWARLPSGRQVVYAGSPRAESDARVEPMQVRPADTLVIAARSATAGSLPGRAEAVARLRAAVAESLGRPGLTILLGAPLLLTELFTEISHELAAHPDASCVAHPLVRRSLRAVRACGLLPKELAMPSSTASGRGLVPGALVLWPLGRALPEPPPELAARLLLVDGLALLPEVQGELRAGLRPGTKLAAGIAFPDGLDTAGLVTYARDCEAREVFLTAGYSPDVASALSQHGIRAQPLGPPRQLALFG